MKWKKPAVWLVIKPGSLDNGGSAIAERSTTDPEVHGLNPDEALFMKKMASKNVWHFSQKDKLQIFDESIAIAFNELIGSTKL